MSRFCKVYACDVPEPHHHRPPTPAEVAEADETYTIRHPETCAWRKDIYDGCSCGVTQHITDLYSLGAVLSAAALQSEATATGEGREG